MEMKEMRRRSHTVRRITTVARAVASMSKKRMQLGHAQDFKTRLDMGELMRRLHMHENGDVVPTNGYGTVNFPATSVGTKKIASYLRLSADDNPLDALYFVQALLTRHIGKGYHRPGLIISVTGGAKNFTLPTRLMDVVRKGLMRAVETTGAWVITGGTHSGVMQLVGTIMRDLTKERFSPVIGIATHGIIEGREALSQDNTENRLDLQYQHNNYKSLDPNHNIFMLVDDGSEEQFGREIAFRAKFEKVASQDFDAPVVVVVIQGGPGTLRTAHDAVVNSNPIVVVEGSGQAADVLAYAWKFLYSEEPEARGYTVEDLKVLIANSFPNNKPDELLTTVLETVQTRHKVWVYDLQLMGNKNLDDAILNAVFYGSDASLKNKLRQAMYFDRIDVAQAALTKVASSLSQDDDAEVVEILNDNLMWSLTSNNPEFVDLYLENGAMVSKLRPTSSWRAERREPLKDHHGRIIELPALALAVEQLYEVAGKSDHSHVGQLVAHSPYKDRYKHRPFCVEHLDKILSGLLGHSFSIKRDWAIFKSDDPNDVKTQETTAYHLLLTWAVCLDKFRMARMFWERGDENISNALVAARMLIQLSKHRALSGPYLADEREKMTHNASKFEELAVGVLAECQSADADLTSSMLHHDIPRFNGKNAIRVAYEADSKNFIAHPAAQTIVNRDWWGGMAERTGFLYVIICLFLPFLVPFLPTYRKDGDVYQLGNLKTETVKLEDLDKDDEHDTLAEHAVSWFKRFKLFYSAPITRFGVDAIGHLALCFLFSYMILTEFASTITVIEVIIMVWFGSIVLEELRQIISNDGFSSYIKDPWNKLDVVMLILYVIGLGFRLSDPADTSLKIQAKTILSFGAIVVWLRLMRYYAFSEFLGPKLIMMARMSADVATFILLLIIFLLGYGVAAQTLLYPDRAFDYQTFENVIYRPYFQIYGELFLEEIEEDSDCIGPWQFSSCGWKDSWLVPVLLAVYILVTNVLLVNLLIAMFNDTYINVQESARLYWHLQNYELVLEYSDRPVLPAPIIALQHIYMIISWCCGRCKDAKVDIDAEEAQIRLSLFQESATEKYQRKQRKEESESLEAQVTRNGETLNEVHSLSVQIEQSLTHLRAAVDRQSIEIANELEDDHTSTTSYVTYKSSNYVPPIQYPGKNAPKRFPVPEEKVPVSSSFPEYSPVEYTDPSVIGAVWADSDIWDSMKFNEMDDGINRKSFFGRYDLDSDGRPINPFGRTGMTGRGLLGRWGPNHAADAIVTRWSRTSAGNILERDGKKVLEFIAVRRNDNNMLAIPGGFVDAKEDAKEAVAREFLEEAMDQQHGLTKVDAEERAAVKELFTLGEPVYAGYSEDYRNTDNAWIETSAMNFHDDTGKYVGKLTLQGGDDAKSAQWVMVHRGLTMFAMHSKLLEKAATMRGSYW